MQPLGLLPAVLICLTFVSTASAAATVSSNWAGYAVTAHSSRTSFTQVTASWVIPAGNCAPGSPSYSSTWVGLGGYALRSAALEQIGTELDCTSGGAVSLSAWYELVPAASHDIHMPVHAGDRIDASVTVSGQRVALLLRNRTSGTTFRRTLAMAAPDTSSAEWIVEAPSDCNNAGRCTQLPLSDFGTFAFSRATVTTTRGARGGIAGSGWSHVTITLGADGRGRGFAGTASAGGATPSAVDGAGSSFSVAYQPA